MVAETLVIVTGPRRVAAAAAAADWRPSLSDCLGHCHAPPTVLHRIRVSPRIMKCLANSNNASVLDLITYAKDRCTCK